MVLIILGELIIILIIGLLFTYIPSENKSVIVIIILKISKTEKTCNPMNR